MNATQEQVDRLAQLFQLASSGDEDGWEGLYLTPDTSGVMVTRDTLDNFRAAAELQWLEVDGRQEFAGAVFWERVQMRKGGQRVSLIVLDCGDFRLCYSQ